MKRFISTLMAASLIISSFTTVSAEEISAKGNDVELGSQVTEEAAFTESNVQFEPQMTESLDVITEMEAFDELTVDGDIKDVNTVDKEIPTFSGEVSPNQKNVRVDGYNTANTAFYLDESNLNTYIGDVANAKQNWYYFSVNPTDKVSVYLSDTNTGDYDVYLYKYNADGTLSMVTYSEYVDSSEHLSYVGSSTDTGYYWLLVNPYVASNPEESYTMRIDTVSTFDSHEPNDNIIQSKNFTNKINTTGTIDNALDVDWYSLTLPASGEYSVSLNNVPSGNTYRVNVYNGSQEFVGYFNSTDTKTVRVAGTSKETYYFEVLSSNGTYNAASSYNLKVMKYHNGVVFTTKDNNIIEIDGANLYTDGNLVDLSWYYDYTTNYTRKEELHLGSNVEIGLDLKTYYRSGFAKGASVKSGNCIMIQVYDSFMFNYYYKYPTYYSESLDNPVFFVDLNTGKLMDYPDSTFYYIDGMSTTQFTTGDLKAGY